MRRIELVLMAAVAAAGVSSAALADDTTANSTPDCQIRDFSTLLYAGNDCGNIWRLQNYLDPGFLRNNGVTVQGWIDGGIMANPDSPHGGFNGPVGYTDRDYGQLNQAYLYVERTAPANNAGLFVGFRADVMFGSDFFYMVSSGLDGRRIGNGPLAATNGQTFRYGTALPQTYLELDYNDFQLKVGHFYDIFGAESPMARENFFYTHTNAFVFGEPTTATGLILSKPIGPNWTVTGGVVNAWNEFVPQTKVRAGSPFSSGDDWLNNIVGGVAYHDKGVSVELNAQWGRASDFNIAGAGPYSNRALVNIVGTVNLLHNLNYTIDMLWGQQDNSLGFNALDQKSASWAGVTQTLIYAFDNKWSAGARFEWFDDRSGYLVTGLRPGNGDALFRFPGSFYDASLGLNYRPIPNLTLGAEIREDWSATEGYRAPLIFGPRPNAPFDASTKSSQFLAGVHATVQF
ncbi:MAG TPA: outer membrane beta-barrel protein [Stellaceae bacterium]|nr:outer membrane beta-barrel protein [Stellaceae bacterium]